jgi:formylglycine-generating enzyme required for sulfatase activity
MKFCKILICASIFFLWTSSCFSWFIPEFEPVWKKKSPAPSPSVGARSGGREWTEPVTGMEFVRIPGGCFSMGSPSGEKGRYSDEGPVHEVCLDSFWLGKYEVTNEQYRKFRANHDSKDYKGHSLNRDKQPAVLVSWEDALAFAEWLGKKSNGRFAFRLPTEAEWEYACRAGVDTARFWGDDSSLACKYANVHDRLSKKAFKNFNWENHNCSDGYEVAAPVGKFDPNNFELYDMLGNVWEWCADIYASDAYSKHRKNNPIYDRGGSNRVGRGGSWNGIPANVRCAIRSGFSPGLRYNGYLGFRLARNH